MTEVDFWQRVEAIYDEIIANGGLRERGVIQSGDKEVSDWRHGCTGKFQEVSHEDIMKLFAASAKRQTWYVAVKDGEHFTHQGSIGDLYNRLQRLGIASRVEIYNSAEDRLEQDNLVAFITTRETKYRRGTRDIEIIHAVVKFMCRDTINDRTIQTKE